MKVHAKKCHPAQFTAVRSLDKRFEWRREDDCRFEVGDWLMLLEFDPEMGYTGAVERVQVSYVLRGDFGVPDGYAVLGIFQVNGETPPKERP